MRETAGRGRTHRADAPCFDGSRRNHPRGARGGCVTGGGAQQTGGSGRAGSRRRPPISKACAACNARWTSSACSPTTGRPSRSGRSSTPPGSRRPRCCGWCRRWSRAGCCGPRPADTWPGPALALGAPRAAQLGAAAGHAARHARAGRPPPRDGQRVRRPRRLPGLHRPAGGPAAAAARGPRRRRAADVGRGVGEGPAARRRPRPAGAHRPRLAVRRRPREALREWIDEAAVQGFAESHGEREDGCRRSPRRSSAGPAGSSPRSG